MNVQQLMKKYNLRTVLKVPCSNRNIFNAVLTYLVVNIQVNENHLYI